MQFEEQGHDQDLPHLANTYCALCLLIMLGDDFSRVKGEEILASLHTFAEIEGDLAKKKHPGKLSILPVESEDDMRFVFCGCAI